MQFLGRLDLLSIQLACLSDNELQTDALLT